MVQRQLFGVGEEFWEYQAAEAVQRSGKSFNLIELGAGDGSKTEFFLKHFSKHSTDFIYTPVDISGNVLDSLKTRLLKTFPIMLFYPINNRNEHALRELAGIRSRKVLLFSGQILVISTQQRAADFLKKLSAVMSRDDRL